MVDFFFRFREKLVSLSPRIKTILIAGLFASFIVIGVFLAKKPVKEVSRPIAPKLTPKTTPFPTVASVPIEKTFTSKEIAEIGLAYLDQQKRADGFYYYFIEPQEGKKNVFAQANMWTILARLGYYQNFSADRQDLTKAEQDAQALMTFCQQDFKQCRAALIPFAMLYSETQKEDYKKLLEEVGELLLEESYGKGVMSLATQARELVWLYEIFVDQGYLNTASQRLSEAKQASENDQATFGFDDEVCHLVLAQTEIGRATSNQVMLEEAIRFFKEGKETQVPGELTLIQPCIESAFILSQTTSDLQAKTKAISLLNQYVTARWYGPGLDRGYQQGGFFMGEDKNLINITDTGYMIYLLGLEPTKSYLFKE